MHTLIDLHAGIVLHLESTSFVVCSPAPVHFMFDKLSIRYKLLVLLGLSLGVGLCVSVCVALYATFAAERQSSLRALHQIAAITSENMRAALAFHDAHSATKIFESLRTNPHIRYAFVQDEHGQMLGQYLASGTTAEQVASLRSVLPSPPWSPVSTDVNHVVQAMEHDHHYVMYPIDFEGKRIGSVGLVADNRAMYAKMQQYVRLQVVASVLIFFILLLLSWRVQLIFTRPIFELISSMRRIGHSKDYGVVLVTHHKDEFQELYQGFNAMLREIRLRDEKLSHLASTDTLTGLANRRRALDSLHAMAARAQQQQSALAVVMLDVDYFKRVNDSYGHPMGDWVLQQVARIVQRHIGATDVAARYGGEEFLLLCADTDAPAAMQLAERIRAAVASHSFDRGDGEVLHVTVSLGVCAAHTTPATVMQLIELADQALYRAKQSGRNRVENAQAD